jgi:hypothetical protein
MTPFSKVKTFATLSFSKLERFHELVLKLFVHHYNSWCFTSLVKTFFQRSAGYRADVLTRLHLTQFRSRLAFPG